MSSGRTKRRPRPMISSFSWLRPASWRAESNDQNLWMALGQVTCSGVPSRG